MERPPKPHVLATNTLGRVREGSAGSRHSSHERSPHPQEHNGPHTATTQLRNASPLSAYVKQSSPTISWQALPEQIPLPAGLPNNARFLHPRPGIRSNSTQEGGLSLEQQLETTGSGRLQRQESRQTFLDAHNGDYPTPNYSRIDTPPLTSTHISHQRPASATSERRERDVWQASVKLQNHEFTLFRTFVEDLSGWLDLFDEKHHFCVDVPQLSLTNPGLMKAILAFSARHASIVRARGPNIPIDSTASFQYYSEALNYLQRNMQYESYTKSPDIIATSLIVSAYEMIDGAGKSWERHLKGVSYMHQSQNNSGGSGGIGQAMWWAWVLQDVWAAFRERRRTLGQWAPTKRYDDSEPYGIARRAIWLLAQVVNFTSDEEKASEHANQQSRTDQAINLMALLDEWEHSLPKCFQPLPRQTGSNFSFQPLWINPPVFGRCDSTALKWFIC